jgi:hypothetical protein
MAKIFKIGIIGGGASGMMCAATILEAESETKSTTTLEILIFDKNPKLGVKVAITGGGRCNVTTGIDDMRILLSKYTRGSNLVKPSLAAFSPQQVRQWFEDHGVPLKLESDNRIFPVSNRSEDIIQLFEQILTDKRVKLHLDEPVLSVSETSTKNKTTTKTPTKTTNKFSLKTAQANYDLDFLVITTGGNTYHETGSNGDGYEFAKSLGHTITKLGPSLNSFTTQELWCKELAGISLPDAQFNFVLSSGEKESVTGPMLFTHFGISGPAIFSLASHIAFEDVSDTNPFKIKFIPVSKISFEICNSIILKEIVKDGSNSLVGILMNFVPRRLAEAILLLTNTKAPIGAELTKEERINLVHFLTGKLELNLIEKMAGVEFVTAGGVSSDEVDRKTMESKLQKGLYFAGEVLNIDALTGGFNLQSAWSTGRSAGRSISNLLVKKQKAD